MDLSEEQDASKGSWGWKLSDQQLEEWPLSSARGTRVCEGEAIGKQDCPSKSNVVVLCKASGIEERARDRKAMTGRTIGEIIKKSDVKQGTAAYRMQ